MFQDGEERLRPWKKMRPCSWWKFPKNTRPTSWATFNKTLMNDMNHWNPDWCFMLRDPDISWPYEIIPEYSWVVFPFPIFTANISLGHCSVGMLKTCLGMTRLRWSWKNTTILRCLRKVDVTIHVFFFGDVWYRCLEGMGRTHPKIFLVNVFCFCFWYQNGSKKYSCFPPPQSNVKNIHRYVYYIWM